METQLKPPTQPRKISEADARRVAHFKEFITDGTSAEHLHKTLVNLYINYTRLLILEPDKINPKTSDDELYYLSEFIEITE
jgi:hypothetical protein